MKAEKSSGFKDQCEPDAVLQAPLSLRILTHPFRVLGSILVLLAFSAYWTWALAKMKDGMVFLPTDSRLLQGFAEPSRQAPEVMVLWCDKCDIQKQPDFDRSRKEVEMEMNNLQKEDPHCRDLEWSSVGNPMPGYDPAFYVSSDQTTSFVEVHAFQWRCMLAVRAKLKRLRRSTGELLASPGSPETVADASMKAEFRTALLHTAFAFPLCSLILWLVVGNVHRVAPLALCLGASYVTGKGLVGFCKRCAPSLNVNFDDSCLLFITLALCTDYALFFWSRFNDERDRHRGPAGYQKALLAALHRSGTVILTSNCFVTLAYSCTMLLPYLNIWAFRGLYIQAAACSATAALYSVTLVPALAVALPGLFDHGSDPCWRLQQKLWSRLPSPQKLWRHWARVITSGPQMFIVPAAAYCLMLPFVLLVFRRYAPSFDLQAQGSRGDLLEHQALSHFESRFNLGLLSPIMLVLEAQPLTPVPQPAGPGGAGLGPGAPLAVRPTLSADASSMLQTGWSASRRGEAHLETLSDSSANIALSLEFGNVTCSLAEQIVRETRGKDCEVRPDDMLGLWWLPELEKSSLLGRHSCVVSHPVASLVSSYRAIRDPLKHIPLEMKRKMPSMLQESLSRDGRRLLLTVMPSFRPTSPEAYEFDRVLRGILSKENRTFTSGGRRYSLVTHHSGAMQVQVDACSGIHEAVPKVLGIFIPLVAITVGISFCSVFLSVKLALTVIVPIVATYGMAIAVYQLGWLDRLGVEMLHESGGLDFRVVVLTAGLLFGFAMDYDLFLFIRVYEHRLEGYDNLSAVRRALTETGPVITTAGTLMVISFFAIMCSHTVFIRTMGFIFTVGALFDVYVVRMMIAPVFLSLAENLNYWPRKMPLATKKWE